MGNIRYCHLQQQIVDLIVTLRYIRISIIILTLQFKVGAPINAFYGYVTGGIFQTSDEVAKHAVQVQGGTAAGDIKFNDLNNDGVINENDRTIIGNLIEPGYSP